MILFVQFSSSCDIVSSLMKIPQHFLPECPEAENTQVCIPAFQCAQTTSGRSSWKMNGVKLLLHVEYFLNHAINTRVFDQSIGTMK